MKPSPSKHLSAKALLAARWLLGALMLLLIATTQAAADSDWAGPGSELQGSTASQALGSGAQQEFLPVEQAYVVTPSLVDGTLSLHWQIAPGYYLYREKFDFTMIDEGESQPLAATFEPGKVIFDEYFNKELTVFYQETDVHLPLPQDEPFDLKVVSQGCADAGLCYPPRTQYFQIDPRQGTVIEVNEVSAPSAASPSAPPLPAQKPAPFLLAVLLAALLGGAILNLMPCVFPVLSLKALSFASSPLSRHKQHVHGWAYTAGVVGSFLLAACIMLLARQAGETIGWGFQLQSPVFVALMAYLFFAMSLSLLGLFTLGTRLMGAGESLTAGHGLRSSFFTGVLAALVASPCTAPLMASALGYAMTQPAAVALVVFGTLGLGMALPFLLLSYMPQLARRLPHPGPWMDTLKQFLAFPLLLTCIWLLWVLGHQVNSDAVVAVLLGGVAIAFGCWLWHRKPASGALRVVLRAVAATAVIFALVLGVRVERWGLPADNQWQTYSPERLAELRAEARPVFVNATADWCITCLANERVALDTEAVQEMADQLDVAMLKADMTNPDPAVSALLERFGRSGVPLYLMYPADAEADAQVLPQILTRQLLIRAMQRAAGR